MIHQANTSEKGLENQGQDQDKDKDKTNTNTPTKRNETKQTSNQTMKKIKSN